MDEIIEFFKDFIYLTLFFNHSTNATTPNLSVPSNKARMASNGVLLCFFAVSTIECISRKASPPSSERNVHEFYSLILSFLIPRSLALLSDGIAGFERRATGTGTPEP